MVDYKYPLPEGTIVEFNVPPLAGTGKICGLATNGDAELGIGYIIEILTLHGAGGVPIVYSHMIVFDYYIKVLKNTIIPDKELLEMACEFCVGYEPIVNGRVLTDAMIEANSELKRYRVYVRNMRNLEPNQPDRWGILSATKDCLSKKGEWIYQHMPSGREEDFYEQCRYASAHEAILYFRRWRKSILDWASKNPKEIVNFEDIPSKSLEF